MSDRKPKILWQAHEGNVSGANIALLEYIDALKDGFYFFVILPHTGNMQQELEKRSIPYRIVHQYGWTNSYTWWDFYRWIKVFLRSFRALWRINSICKSENPTLICTNTLVPFIPSVSAWLLQIPHIWWIHEFGKEDFGFTTGWGWEKLSFAWMSKSSQLIIGNSHAVSNKFKQLMPSAQIQTIYQPVSWRNSNAHVEKKLARYIMFGQLIPSKGHIEVLQAIIDNIQNGKPTPTLHIKGPCEVEAYLHELQTIISRHKLQDYIHVESGFFNKKDVLPYYDVLITASHAEAFGRVIIEANKAGLRVLVRNRGGAPELMNETNGLLFENRNELSAILSGEVAFPVEPIHSNYKEEEQIQRLTELLLTICR